MLIRRRDALALAALLALCLALYAPLAAGRVYFWGDLTYLHFPWKTLAAQAAQGGRFPHWNPYAYSGMPLHAAFQAGVLYPLSVPFFLWGFETALALYLPLHGALAAAFTFLWLRRAGCRRQGALLG